jgi:hypothetical protein
MYVCMYVCVCAYVWMKVWMYVFMHVCIYVCMYVRTYTNVHIHNITTQLQEVINLVKEVAIKKQDSMSRPMYPNLPH